MLEGNIKETDLFPMYQPQEGFIFYMYTILSYSMNLAHYTHYTHVLTYTEVCICLYVVSKLGCGVFQSAHQLCCSNRDFRLRCYQLLLSKVPYLYYTSW